MATHSPTDPNVMAIDVPALPVARKAFLDHQLKRPKRPDPKATQEEIRTYDRDLVNWLDTKEKLSLRLELAQAKERGDWHPCATPAHPCPQPEAPPAPKPPTARPLMLTRKPAPLKPQEAPMTKGIYNRKKSNPQERLDRLVQVFREARTPSSQRNAKQHMRDICREFSLPLPKEAQTTVTNQKAQPEKTGAIAASSSPAQAAKGAPTPESAALKATAAPIFPEDFPPVMRDTPRVHNILSVHAPAHGALLRMRKEGWLLLAAAETLSPAEREALVETIEMVRGQLDMALTLARGAA